MNFGNNNELASHYLYGIRNEFVIFNLFHGNIAFSAFDFPLKLNHGNSVKKRENLNLKPT